MLHPKSTKYGRSHSQNERKVLINHVGPSNKNGHKLWMGPQMLAKKHASFIEWTYYYFCHVLSILMGGPIILLNCAANNFGWAHYVLWECFWCLWMGPAIFGQDLSKPIRGPINELSNASSYFKWAQHYFYGTFWSLCVGSCINWAVLSIISDGPSNFLKKPSETYVWAQPCFNKCC